MLRNMGAKMTWSEIRKTYPNTYILLKNFGESRHGDKITILSGEVLQTSQDPKTIYHQYKTNKEREKIIFGYTGWETFEIEEHPFIGIRPAHE